MDVHTLVNSPCSEVKSLEENNTSCLPFWWSGIEVWFLWEHLPTEQSPKPTLKYFFQKRYSQNQESRISSCLVDKQNKAQIQAVCKHISFNLINHFTK